MIEWERSAEPSRVTRGSIRMDSVNIARLICMYSIMLEPLCKQHTCALSIVRSSNNRSWNERLDNNIICIVHTDTPRCAAIRMRINRFDCDKVRSVLQNCHKITLFACRFNHSRSQVLQCIYIFHKSHVYCRLSKWTRWSNLPTKRKPYINSPTQRILIMKRRCHH